jgi:hypothetical protein
MKVQLEKSFPLAAPADSAWALLQDIEAVAGCMPGARITQRLDDRHFKGTVGVRIGPASMNFRGDIEVQEVDAATRSVHLVGRGTDNTGTSGAAMDLRARIEPADATACVLVGTSEVSVSGKAATFGGRLMSGVADQVLKQFVANFSERLKERAPAAPSAAAPGTGGDTPAAANAPMRSAEAAQPAAARDLNPLAVAWGMVRDWFHHLFARRA